MSVVGTVGLWGRVIEHEHGYRAALAYPLALRLVMRRAFAGALGKAVAVGYALLASLALLTAVAALTGRLPRPAG